MSNQRGSILQSFLRVASPHSEFSPHPWRSKVGFGSAGPGLAALVLTVCVAIPALGQTRVIRTDIHHDVSPPLRDLAKTASSQQGQRAEAEPVRVISLPPGFKPSGSPDLARQRTTAAAALSTAPLSPTLLNNFDGIGQDVFGVNVFVAPPDTNGAVGLTQYVQWVNLSFAVFDKQTGNILPNFPVFGNTLWQGFGGGCEFNNDGDPIVVYDKLADRWVFSQLMVQGDFLQCVAVSTTSDATGTYNRYSFSYPNFDDYPKMGVWPDAYYITFNMFGPNSLLGADACAYDRNAMLNGQAATQICFQQVPSVSSLLPADLDGHRPPPQGSPNYMLGLDVNSVDLYKFHVDFTTPANSTFSPATNIPVTPFTPLLCNFFFSCVPQPNTSNLLDSLGDRLMYRLAYRNFGDHESLVVSHSVAVNANSGVRWYEIQNPGGTPVVAQQSTFAPDDDFRWMGSIAMDTAGDIALGYSISGPNTFPSIAITGQAFSDPRNTLQTEVPVVSGTGSQINGLSRWGDYSAMQIDPVDDCTFWYTTEYIKNTGSFNWNTRIANFKFPSCNIPDLTIASTHSGNFTQGDTGKTYTITVTNVGSKPTDSSTVTVTDTLPTGLSFNAVSGQGWTCPNPGSTVTCTRTDVLASKGSYPAITLTVNVASNAPGFVTNTATVSGGGDQNPNNNTSNDQTTIIQTGPDPAITKIHSGSFIQGLIGTYTITVTNVGLSPTDGTTVTVTDTLPTGLTFNGVTGTGWSCNSSSPVTCTRSDALPSNASYPAITLTVNVASNALPVINTTTVSGGGDTNSLNNTASDPTNVTPPPPDLTITKTHFGNFNQGQTAPYTLTVSNLGGGPTVGSVIVTDMLPLGFTAANMFGEGWFCNAGTATCARNDVLPINSSYPPITLSVNVPDNAPAMVTNTAVVSGGGDVTPANDTASDLTTINPAPDLTIALSHTPDPFTVGQTGTYTMTVSNVGSVASFGPVLVRGLLPFGLVATAMSGPGWDCAAGNVVSCARSDALSPGSSYPAITLTVSVIGGSPNVVTRAVVNGGGEFNLANDLARDKTNINGPVLTITKSHTGVFTVGQPGTYTITVGNKGAVATLGTVTVRDFFPRGFMAAAVSAGWDCSPLPTDFLNCTQSDSLAPGSSYPPLNVTVSIGDSLPTVINFAEVVGGGDSLLHLASDQTTVNTPTLTITKTHTDPFTVGQPGTYTITVGNTGSVATTGTVTVADNLPRGMMATGVSGAGWNCGNLPTQFLNCTRLDSLATNSSYPALNVSVSIGNVAPTTTNRATVTGGGDRSVHVASDLTNINTPTLTITKTHADPFTVGQPGTYIITVGNTGKIATVGAVTLTDFLPLGMTATAVSGAGWNCNNLPTQILSCTRSDVLAVNSSYPPLNVTIGIGNIASAVTNTATVTGGGDGLLRKANDLTNINTPTLTITKTHTGDFTVGQPGAYTITVGNTGKAATAGTVTLTDFLPSGMLASAVSGAGWSCGFLPTQFLSCTRSDSLATSSSYPPLNLTVSLGNMAPTVTNMATVTGGGDGVFHSASDPTNINTPALTITKTHIDPFTAGQPGTYTITVGNVGKIATVGTVSVQDFLPFGMTATGVSGTGWSCPNLPTSFLNCTRSDALATGSSYPPLNVTVSLGNMAPTVTNMATVTGGGDGLSHSASDLTNINTPTLTITKTHTGDFTVGQPGTYTITVGNVGKIATVGTVSIQDSLPFGMTATAVSGAGWNCPNLPLQFMNCTRSDALATGSSYPPLTVTVSIGDTVPAVINRASVTGGGDGIFHFVSDPTGINVPVLTITKTHSGNFISGQTGTYTITVGNVGKVATVGTVTLQDSLPNGMSTIAMGGTGWSCSQQFPTSLLICTRPDALATGSSYPPLTIIVNVTGAGATSATNGASVSGGGDAVFHSASDTASIETPVLAITKSHNGNFAVGQPGTYTITVSNTGIIATNGTVTVTDSLPFGMTLNSANGTGWTCTPGNINTVTCTRSDALAVGASYPAITLIVNVTGSGFNTTNTASVTGGGDSSTHLASDNTIINAPTLSISKTHTGDFTVGQPGTYNITVSNVGQIATTGTVTVNDSLPFSMTATAITATGWSCSTPPATVVICNRSDALAAGASYPMITLTVSVTSSGVITNFVNVSGGGDNNFHSSIDTVNVNGPTLAITKTHSPDPFTVGQPGTYTITVSNVGQTATTANVNVSDSLPFGMTATAITATGWSCSSVPTSFVSCTRSDSLAPNTSYPAITVTVSVSSGGTVINSAGVAGGGDSSFHNANDTVNIVSPTLAITKTHSGNFTVGQQGTYTITVSNVGTLATVGQVMVSDFLPQGLTANTVSGTGWACSGTFFVSCTRSDSLAANSSYPAITLTVDVGSSLPNITNSATVTGGGDGASHTAFDPTFVVTPTLAITKTHSGDFTVGQTGTYTITVSNIGQIATTGIVTINDFLPFNMTATAVNNSGWSCPGLPTSFLICTRSDSLAPNNSYPPLIVTVSVTGGPSAVINGVNVTGGGDGMTHNATDPTNINTPVLAIAKTHTDPFTPGQTGTYTITVSNPSSIATSGQVNVNEILPVGLTLNSMSGTGWSCSTFFGASCNRSDSLAGNSSYPPITVTVNVGSSVSSEVVNQANVFGGGDFHTHTVRDLTKVNLPDLAIAKSHTGMFFAGQTGAVYTITVSNVGTVPTAGGSLLVTDQLPVGLTATSASGSGWNCSILPGPQTELDCTQPAGNLAPGSSYPPITLTANVATNAPSSLSDTVSVFGIGDADFSNNFATDKTTVRPFLFALTSTPSVSVNAGSQATFTFAANFATGQPTGTLMFSATGLPANSTATFSPTSLTQSGQVMVTLDTSGNGHVAASLRPGSFNRLAPYSLVVFAAVVIWGVWPRKGPRRQWLLAWIAVGALGVALAFVGCGGGGSPPPPPPPPPTVTPSGTYTVVVTATSSNTGVAPVSVPVTLVVK